MQVWLADPAMRSVIRDFIIEILNALPNAASIIQAITPGLNNSLDVQPSDSPAELEEPKTKGTNILKLLEPLFKNS